MNVVANFQPSIFFLLHSLCFTLILIIGRRGRVIVTQYDVKEDEAPVWKDATRNSEKTASCIHPSGEEKTIRRSREEQYKQEEQGRQEVRMQSTKR